MIARAIVEVAVARIQNLLPVGKKMLVTGETKTRFPKIEGRRQFVRCFMVNPYI
jgi:hypothetical protein